MAENTKKYHIVTYGCQMNVHDSEAIAGILEDNGYICSDKKEDADIIIINTCCVRESAEKKITGNIGALKALKTLKPDMKIIVCGCMTQQEGEAARLLKRFSFIDVVLGTHNMHEFGEIIKNLRKEDKKTVSIYGGGECIWEGRTPKRNTYPLSFVNIMYGCDNYCSYCIVPYVRGREKSRRPEAVIDEIKALVLEGYKEVTLLGQNVNSYGKGLEKTVAFAGLLEMIEEKTHIPRIRFMTSHPKDLSEELLDAYANLKSLCSHIHLPVQSGSDRILKLMNRNYTARHYISLIERLREKRSGIAVTTDIIAGFPGETEEDFEKTLELVKTVRFDSAYTFIYSSRSGTAAAKMEGQLTREVKSQRINKLIEIQNAITKEINDSIVGKTESILVESVSARNNSHICGRTSSTKLVNFEGDRELIGSFVNVKITESKRNTLFGKII